MQVPVPEVLSAKSWQCWLCMRSHGGKWGKEVSSPNSLALGKSLSLGKHALKNQLPVKAMDRGR